MEAELGQRIRIAKETGIQGRANKRSHGSMDKQLFPLNWLSFSSPFKILTIKEKLSLAWLLDWKKLIVETDSLFASQLLNRRGCSDFSTMPIFYDAWRS